MPISQFSLTLSSISSALFAMLPNAAFFFFFKYTYKVDQMVKCLPAMWETQVRFLG